MSPAPEQPLQVALVHERFTERGGSEDVVAALQAIWPGSEVFAPLVDARAVPSPLDPGKIRSSHLQRFYRGGRPLHLLPFLPAAIARLPVGTPDLVITSHHTFANRIRVAPEVPVLSYVHTPARWIWEPGSRSELPASVRRSALAAFAAAHRGQDRAAAARPDVLLANSRTVQDRIARWWGRESTVVHPPADTEFFTPGKDADREDFYLLAGRLVPYKSPQVAVAAANRHGFRLVVAGEGRMRPDLERLAGPNVSFLGRVDRDTLRDLHRRCRALLYPGEEDFGLVPVEAAACGAPVVALGVGGVRDSVVDGRTGVLYAPTGEPVADLFGAIQRLQQESFRSQDIRQQAEQFSVQRFNERLSAEVAVLTGRR
jgi:glycosyltransferase involved in cell wall biosynthesis